MTLRFERKNGTSWPLLERVTAHWLLVQWDWTRERLNLELHPAYQGDFLCERCVPPGAEVYTKGYPDRACQRCGVVGLCCRLASKTVH